MADRNWVFAVLLTSTILSFAGGPMADPPSYMLKPHQLQRLTSGDVTIPRTPKVELRYNLDEFERKKNERAACPDLRPRNARGCVRTGCLTSMLSCRW